jgi:hypothetical protein
MEATDPELRFALAALITHLAVELGCSLEGRQLPRVLDPGVEEAAVHDPPAGDQQFGLGRVEHPVGVCQPVVLPIEDRTLVQPLRQPHPLIHLADPSTAAAPADS